MVARKKTVRSARRRTIRGRGIWSKIKSWGTRAKNWLAPYHDSFKREKVLSQLLNIMGYDNLGKTAELWGYGRKKRRTTRGRGRRITTRRTIRGRGFFSKLWDGVKYIGSAAAPALIGYAAKRMLGLGRLKRGRGRSGLIDTLRPAYDGLSAIGKIYKAIGGRRVKRGRGRVRLMRRGGRRTVRRRVQRGGYYALGLADPNYHGYRPLRQFTKTGGRRRRTTRMRGRGIFGKIIGGLLPF